MSDFTKRFPYVIQAKVEWADMDAFQHVNNTNYLRYFERVRMEYFQQYGFFAYMNEHNVGPILASTSCKFKAPLSYPDKILIGMGVQSIEDDRFNMLFAVYSDKFGCVAAEGEGLIIYYDYGKGEKTNIPDQFRVFADSLMMD